MRIATLVIFILLLVPVTQAGDWPMFRHDPAHSGVADEIVEPPLKLVWDYSTDYDISGNPTISGGKVYFGLVDGNVYALDSTTGALKWKYKTAGSVSSPAVVGGVVYVGSDNLYALDAITGALKWRYKTGGSLSSPTISGGIVYVGSADNSVYALDAITGTLKWKYNSAGTVVYSSPAVFNGVVYFGSWDSNVYALDATTGALKWKYKTDYGVQASPAVSGDVVYVGSAGGTMYALNALTGALVWNGKNGGVIRSSAAISNGVVYIGFEAMYALAASTGNSIWNSESNSNYRPSFSSPAVSGDVVYVGMDGTLGAFDAKTGKWLGSSYGSFPAVSGGMVYTATDRYVSAFAHEQSTFETWLGEGSGIVDLGKQRGWIEFIAIILFMAMILKVGTGYNQKKRAESKKINEIRAKVDEFEKEGYYVSDFKQKWL